MRGIQRYRDEIAVSAGLVLPIVVAAVISPLRHTLANAAAALILVAVVVAVAANGNRLAGYVAAVSASLWFNFFLTAPYERFAITHRPDIETAVSLFVVGIAVTELAARNRFHHGVAAEGSDFVGRIYVLSEMVANGATSQQVIDCARTELVEVLHLRSCHFDSNPADHPVTQIDHNGQVQLGTVRWGVHQMGLPTKELEMLVQRRGEVLGRFVLEPTPGWPISMQRRVVAVAIADQVGAALTPHLRSA